MTSAKTLAYSYIRMSTDIQLKGDSKRRQLELSRAYADAHNLQLVSESYEDIGISAYKSKNSSEGEFFRLLEAARNEAIPKGSYLLVESLDRISRDDAYKALSTFTEIISLGITIVTLTDGKIYNSDTLSKSPTDLLYTIIVMIRANEESSIKSRRISAAWEQKRKNVKDRPLTSRAPAWLALDKKSGNFELKEAESEIVKRIFELSIAGLGAFAIARKLNDEKTIPIGRSSHWHKSYVTKILTNVAAYGEFQPMSGRTGKRTPDGPLIEDYFPKVITKKEFLLSRARTKNRKLSGSGRKGKNFTNLFTRIAKCGHCGRSICYKNKGDGPKGGKYLRCSLSDLNGACDAPSWGYQEFETYFLKYINELNLTDIFSPDVNKSTITSLYKEIAETDSELEILESQYENLLTLLSSFSVDVAEDIRKKIENKKKSILYCEGKRDSLEIELASLDNKSSQSIKNAVSEYENGLLADENNPQISVYRNKVHVAIKDMIKEIVIYNKVSDFAPYVELTRMCDRDLTRLISEGYDTFEKAEDFLFTEKGKTFFNKMQRKFEVKFRNGMVKEVWPFLNRYSIAKSTLEYRMRRFRSKSKE